jgi:hypothetical protein
MGEGTGRVIAGEVSIHTNHSKLELPPATTTPLMTFGHSKKDLMRRAAGGEGGSHLRLHRHACRGGWFPAPPLSRRRQQKRWQQWGLLRYLTR